MSESRIEQIKVNYISCFVPLIRSVESLYEELVVKGLLKPVDSVKLHDFIGMNILTFCLCSALCYQVTNSDTEA